MTAMAAATTRGGRWTPAAALAHCRFVRALHCTAPLPLEMKSSRLAAMRAQLRLDNICDERSSDRAPVLPLATATSLSMPLAPSAALLDSHGRQHRYLRISLTERCNLRCTYCMPADGVALSHSTDLLTTSEILRLSSLFASLGVTKMRLTGGEPTLRSDLVPIVSYIASLPGVHTVAMTTNGVRLGPLLPALRGAGLTHINISLDTLQRDRFEAISRRSPQHWDRAWASITAAIDIGYAPVKVNCVVVRGVNDDEVCDFVELTRSLPIQVRFIELMPFSDNAWQQRQFMSSADTLARLRVRFPSISRVETRRGPGPSQHGETARVWKVDGHAGTIGFISSMSDAFCGSCDRLRLTADGSVKACLHGREEVSLRAALRSSASGDAGASDDAALLELIRASVGGKHRALGGSSGMQQLASWGDAGGRPMVKIGG